MSRPDWLREAIAESEQNTGLPWIQIRVLRRLAPKKKPMLSIFHSVPVMNWNKIANGRSGKLRQEMREALKELEAKKLVASSMSARGYPRTLYHLTGQGYHILRGFMRPNSSKRLPL